MNEDEYIMRLLADKRIPDEIRKHIFLNILQSDQVKQYLLKHGLTVEYDKTTDKVTITKK